MVVSTISLWDQFSEYEAVEMAKLRGNFPVAIGLRLKLSRYYGFGYATRGSSSFILSPPIPEAIELQSWCSANSSTIRELPYPTVTGARALIHDPTHPKKIVKILNLPTSVDKVEYLNVQGDIQVIDFNQNFIYLACSICNKSTNAYGDNDFWCNFCNKKVAPLPKAKLNVQITDDTGSVGATIFTEKAEGLYDVTATELAQHASAGNLPISLIEKLSAPKKHYISLKATMYDYGGINRCVFNIDSVSEPINADELLQIEPSQEQQSQPQPPKTPSKRAQAKGSKNTSTA
ncbi:replication protein A 70 kDa DNA-binding subunit B-like isoform X2 [Rhododendron vialii]|uniref:replication protein A 70 kDa DNA-binding subunit B-like isoform X2 n=1 Tax=Rhododendron vialii TaxID=182163 RepID=UPI00265F75AA|nr:replication protein A 70 kDa DNA-binding subunit B-like isoform X2 [Rhododendron vialii]